MISKEKNGFVVSHVTETQLWLYNMLFPLSGQSPSKPLWNIHQPYIENDVQQTLRSRLKFNITENMTYFLYVPHSCSTSLTEKYLL